MSKSPDISEAEWEVMEVLWRRSPLSAAAVAKALKKKRWAPNTVRTMLSRLVSKGALAFSAEGNRYFYHAVVRREDCVQGEVDSLAARLFGGAIRPLLLHFVQNKKLSSSDIAELKKILEEKEGRK